MSGWAPNESFPDGPFPTGYFPVGNPVREGDLAIYALQPQNNLVPRVFILRVYDADRRLRGEQEVPMDYENRWGIDAADLARLEKTTDDLIMEVKGGL